MANKKQKHREKTVNLIKMEPILEILTAAIFTGKLANDKPVSVMLVAEQESAKTEALKYFRGTPTLEYLSDLTSKGILAFKHPIESGKLRHLVLLDMVRIVEHGRTVTNRTIQSLSSLVEEGESGTADAGGREDWKGFPRIGLLTSITPSFYKSNLGKWRKTGFMSRFLPVRFHYTGATVNAVHKAIGSGHSLANPIPIKLPEFSVNVTLDEKHSQLIARRAQKLGVENKTYGFRYHRAMRSLARASAAMDQRHTVTNDDILRVIGWSEFFSGKEVEL